MSNHNFQNLFWYHQQGLTEYWVTPLSKPKALKALYQKIENFQGCRLKDSAENTVLYDGHWDSPLMIIGEAPGAEEDRQGKPFVGMSGQLLNAMLASIGLHRHDVYITNVVPWRPPFNRQPTSEEISLCLPFLEEHIFLISPGVLLLLGSVACQSLLKTTTPMGRLQMEEKIVYQHPLLSRPIPCVPLFHPSYLMRSPGQKRVAWHQFIKLKKILASLPHGGKKI